MFSELIKDIRCGRRTAIARAITIIENGLSGDTEILSDLYPHTGKAYRIGITGPPGAGKSSLTDKLVKHYRLAGKKVAVIGVDPTSPFTGGALLGDRIRMISHYADEGVFIRSMASRGGQGGLAQKTQEVGDVFDAAGYDLVLFETVGVGQVELDVIQATDSVVVVLVPESGDEIQMMKAGLMEIGDVFVINKADRDGANKLNITLTNMLAAIPEESERWNPSVVKTIATTESGIEELLHQIDEHRRFVHETGLWQKKNNDRYIRQVRELIQNRFSQNFWNDEQSGKLQTQLKLDRSSRKTPYQLADEIYA